MAKIKHYKMEHDGKVVVDQYWYWCEGCGYEHAFGTKGKEGGHHEFNGDMENPTVSPSLLHSNPQRYKTCHSFIKDGHIQYLGDCWHKLAGQTIELPDIDQKLKEREEKHKNK